MVQGKIFLWQASPKTMKQYKVIKQDITLADTTVIITIHKWEPVLNDITDKCSYKITHQSVKYFGGKSSYNPQESLAKSMIWKIDNIKSK